MEREGTAVTCDRRLFHRRAAATGNALSPTVDRRVRRTSKEVDEAERSRRLASVTAGRRSSSIRHVGSSRQTMLKLVYAKTLPRILQ